MASEPKKPRRKSTAVSVSAASVREFRKTNEAIGMRVTEGRLTLLTRKLFNVMIFHAQEQGTPGKNAPIDTAAAQKNFWVPLSELAKDARYDSKDTDYLKDQLREMQDIKLVLENERQWTSERLVASVSLVNPHGLRSKHGGQVWLGFSFPPEVHEIVMSPGTYTRMSIFYQAQLRTGPGLALYEICRRYATNPTHLTRDESVDYWHEALSGRPIAERLDVPYKYFKRDTLKPAIAEVNALTDITVELIEHRAGRSIARLQFRTFLKAQREIVFPSPPLIDTALIQSVEQIGFSREEANDFIAVHGAEKIRASVQFVQARQSQTNSPPLDSPAAYFRWTLREGAAAARGLLQAARAEEQPDAKKPAAQPAVEVLPAAESLMERFLRARAEEALAVYRELEDPKKREILERWRCQGAPKGVHVNRGLDSPMVKSFFSRWYAKELWGEPTAEHLAIFIDKYSLDGAAKLVA